FFFQVMHQSGPSKTVRQHVGCRFLGEPADGADCCGRDHARVGLLVDVAASVVEVRRFKGRLFFSAALTAHGACDSARKARQADREAIAVSGPRAALMPVPSSTGS
ncbi:hypothetical protein, partial [Mycoplana ramosa]|uniref:hypothetical protein n=1 Tax=Mycoplana ramosa TaxID=40837 RepID=UPI0035BBBA6C